MDFEWDEDKNAINRAKHKIDFADAAHVFLDVHRKERMDPEWRGGEDRWQTIGRTRFGVLFVVYTERRGGDVVRIISARKATRRERNAYGDAFGRSVGGWS